MFWLWILGCRTESVQKNMAIDDSANSSRFLQTGYGYLPEGTEWIVLDGLSGNVFTLVNDVCKL